MTVFDLLIRVERLGRLLHNIGETFLLDLVDDALQLERRHCRGCRLERRFSRLDVQWRRLCRALRRQRRWRCGGCRRQRRWRWHVDVLMRVAVIVRVAVRVAMRVAMMMRAFVLFSESLSLFELRNSRMHVNGQLRGNNFIVAKKLRKRVDLG